MDQQSKDFLSPAEDNRWIDKVGGVFKKLAGKTKMALVAQAAGIGEYKYGRLGGVGPIGEVNPTKAPSALTRVISTVIGVLSVSAIIYFIFQVIFAGYAWISAGGDSQKIQEAQKKIYSSVLGIFLVLVAVAFVSLVGFLFGGVDFLNLETIIRSLVPTR